MSWNEPGGKDPWGSGGGNSPPDLDALLRRLSERLNRILGGKASGDGSGRGPLLAILAGLAALWFLSGWYQIDAQQQAVVLRFGKFHQVSGEGLHWRPRLVDQVIKVAVTTERRYETQPRNEMLTKDENIVELPLTVQYNIGDVKAYVLQVRDPELSLREATDSALRHEVGSTKFDAVISTGRADLSVAVARRLQTYLDQYGTGIHVVKVNIQEAKPPAAVRSAYDDVVKAREDRERIINEAQSYANGVVPEARGHAQRAIEEANAYRERVVAEAQGEAQRFEKLLAEYRKAPEVTRQRLYVETLEQVVGNSSKVLVDVRSGNNVLYLPLDKLGQSAPSAQAGAPRRLADDQLNDIATRAAELLRSELASPSRREGR
ncbi:MAG: FtsH protease activity modulator HflK [Pseudomonadales bacterium]|nr:FtsH protease activity modulator HflK [Pseudomonadales bacterium]